MMDFRKIIGFGGNSYIVSIPKSWVEKNMLKRGDTLSVKENSGDIVFSINNKPQKKEPRTVTIEADNKPINLIKSEIVAAYLNNYDFIEIISGGFKENARIIKETIRNLSGLEIMMQTSKRIVAKDLLNISEISIKTIIQRMDFITRAMIDDSIECLDGADNYEDINQRDEDVNRFYFLAHRVVRSALKDQEIIKAFNTTPWELSTEGTIVMRIEKIADRQKRIARYLRLITLDKDNKEKLYNIYDNLRKGYLDVMKAYYTKDKGIAFQVEISNKDRIRECDSFLDEHSACLTKLNRKGISELRTSGGRRYCAELAKIIENMKAMTSSIKYIARAIIGMD